MRRKRGGMAKGPGATQKEREKRGNDAGGENAGAETGTRRSAGAERGRRRGAQEHASIGAVGPRSRQAPGPEVPSRAQE